MAMQYSRPLMMFAATKGRIFTQVVSALRTNIPFVAGYSEGAGGEALDSTRKQGEQLLEGPGTAPCPPLHERESRSFKCVSGDSISITDAKSESLEPSISTSNIYVDAFLCRSNRLCRVCWADLESPSNTSLRALASNGGMLNN